VDRYQVDRRRQRVGVDEGVDLEEVGSETQSSKESQAAFSQDPLGLPIRDVWLELDVDPPADNGEATVRTPHELAGVVDVWHGLAGIQGAGCLGRRLEEQPPRLLECIQ
jgi:hypothetical protein